MDIRIDKSLDKKLKQIAIDKGFIDRGRPSTGRLVEAIVRGEIPLGDRQHLLDAPWYDKVVEFIDKKQSFSIHYLDANGDRFEFKATCAKIIWREKRNYLEIYDPELLENYQSDNIKGLKNNRCLRLDRISKDAGVSAIDLPWREAGLAKIEVCFDLFDGLSYSYSEKPGDRTEWIDTGHKRVWRKITNDFWFLRTIAAYRDRVKILGPQDLVAKHIAQLKNALDRYKK